MSDWQMRKPWWQLGSVDQTGFGMRNPTAGNVSGAQVWSRMEGWPRKTGGKEVVAIRGNEGTNLSYTN